MDSEHLGVETHHRPPWYKLTVVPSSGEVPGQPINREAFLEEGAFQLQPGRGGREKVEGRVSV